MFDLVLSLFNGLWYVAVVTLLLVILIAYVPFLNGLFYLHVLFPIFAASKKGIWANDPRYWNDGQGAAPPKLDKAGQEYYAPEKFKEKTVSEKNASQRNKKAAPSSTATHHRSGMRSRKGGRGGSEGESVGNISQTLLPWDADQGDEAPELIPV